MFTNSHIASLVFVCAAWIIYISLFAGCIFIVTLGHRIQQRLIKLNRLSSPLQDIASLKKVEIDAVMLAKVRFSIDREIGLGR